MQSPSILLLDEATSALDRGNEKLIQRKVSSYGDKLTVVSVTHNIGTIKNTDMVLLLDHGEIAEFGSYQELQNMQGLFF